MNSRPDRGTEMSEANPTRWLTPEFPGNGHYEHDEEIGWINSLESGLPEKIPIIRSFEEFEYSDSEIAKIRVEIQCATQHCHAAYFENIEALLNNIGKLRRDRGVMWCGFGVIGQDDPAQRDQMPVFPEHLHQRREGILAALWEWLQEVPLVEAKGNGMIPEQRVEWIYSSLGEWSDAKCWLVGCLCHVLKLSFQRPKPVILSVDLSRYSLQNLLPRDNQSAISDDAAILDQVEKRYDLTDDIRAIRKAMERLVEADVCHFRFNRWVDNLIVAIGQLRFNGAHAPAEPAIAVEGWIDSLRQYIRAINAWIDGVTSQEAVTLVGGPASVIHRVYALLGDASATKVWLAASLSRTVRGIGDPFRPYDEAPPHSFRTQS